MNPAVSHDLHAAFDLAAELWTAPKLPCGKPTSEAFARTVSDIMVHHRVLSRPGKASTAEPEPEPAPDTDAPMLSLSLRARLKDWRLQVSRDRGIPTYTIFKDTTLNALAEQQPKTAVALARIPGLGPKRIKRYGPALLAIITDPPNGTSWQD